jgi:hypothetical protein
MIEINNINYLTLICCLYSKLIIFIHSTEQHTKQIPIPIVYECAYATVTHVSIDLHLYILVNPSLHKCNNIDNCCIYTNRIL